MLACEVVLMRGRPVGVYMGVSDLFTSPVLDDVAPKREKAGLSELPRITAADRREQLRLSFAQQRLWFLAQMERGSEAYHIPWGVRVAGHLDAAILRRVLDRILARHAALRTSFCLVDGEPGQ